MSDGLQFERHPDANLLSGFAEGTLTERERAVTMEHLAECAMCREIVFLVSGAVPLIAVEDAPVAGWRRWFAPLPVFGMGVAAAACAVLLVVTLRPRHAAPVVEQQQARMERPEPMVAPVPEKAPPPAPEMMAALPAPRSPARPVASLPASPKVLGMAKPKAASVGNEDASLATARLRSPEMKAVHGAAAPVNVAGGTNGMPAGDALSQPAAKVPSVGSGAAAVPSVGSGAAAVAIVASSAAPAPASATVTVDAAQGYSMDVTNAVSMTAMLPDVGEGFHLPSKRPVVETANVGGVVLALDDRGGVYRSTNWGKRWKLVKPQWEGNATALDADGVFKVTVASGAVWTSFDGKHWTRQ